LEECYVVEAKNGEIQKLTYINKQRWKQKQEKLASPKESRKIKKMAADTPLTLTQWKARASRAETANETLDKDYKALEARLQKREDELEAQKQRSKDAEDATQAAKANDDLQNQRISDLETELHNAGEEAKRLNTQIQTRDVDVAKAKAAEATATSQFNNERRDFNTFKEDMQGLRNEYQESQDRIAALNAELTTLRDELDQLKNVEDELIKERQTTQGMRVIARKIQNDMERTTQHFNQTPGYYVAPSKEDSKGAGSESLDKEIERLGGGSDPDDSDSSSQYSKPDDKPGDENKDENKTKAPSEPTVTYITRFIPYDTTAHSPITCWFQTERNMLILFVHWLTQFFSLVRQLSGFPVAPPPGPPEPPAMMNQAIWAEGSTTSGYGGVPMMMSQATGGNTSNTGGNGGLNPWNHPDDDRETIPSGNRVPLPASRLPEGIVGLDPWNPPDDGRETIPSGNRVSLPASRLPGGNIGLDPWNPPDDGRQTIPLGDRVPLPANRLPGGNSQTPGTLAQIFTSDPLRIPPAWETFTAFLCHIIIYLALFAGYLAYQERNIWLDANGETRRLLHQLSSYHRSGVSFIASILPASFARWYDMTLYNLLDSWAIPIANPPMPG
jgi:hypothetical protein